MEEVWCIICSLELHSPYTLTFILISDTKVPMVISFELLEKNLRLTNMERGFIWIHIVRFHLKTHQSLHRATVCDDSSQGEACGQQSTHFMAEKARLGKLERSQSHTFPFRSMLNDQQMSHSALPLKADSLIIVPPIKGIIPLAGRPLGNIQDINYTVVASS